MQAQKIQGPTKALSSVQMGKVLVAPAAILVAIYLYYFGIYKSYFPYGDDPAVLHASSKMSAAWITEGFSRYFIVYPEWNNSFTNFMRPVVNLLMWLEQAAFGHHYSLYFATYFAAQYALCVFTILVAKHLGASQRGLYAVGIATALSPAFIGEGLYSIVFHFDTWCGLFTVASLYLVLRGRYALAVIAMTAAVFTKESALYAPIAAALTVFLLTRHKVFSASMLTPILLWIAARKFVFKGGSSPLPASWVSTLIKGIMVWPTGVFDEHTVRRVLIHHALDIPNLLLLVSNVFLWVFIITVAVRYRSIRVHCLLIWVFGALSFGVLIAQDKRFGGSIYPLELVLCSVAFCTLPRLSTYAMSALSASFVWSAWMSFHIAPPMVSMKPLISALHVQTADVVYVLDSPSSFSSPDEIAKEAGIKATLIILNQVHGCAIAPSTRPRVHKIKAGLNLNAVLPMCAQYEFDGIEPSLISQGFKGSLARGKYASYNFPTGHVTERAIGTSRITNIDMGKILNLTVYPDSRSYVILYYDWNTGSFIAM